MNPCTSEALALNNNLHRVHLGYLEMALCHIHHGRRLEAARLLRVFAASEKLREQERKRITRHPSPHQGQHNALKRLLSRAIHEKCEVLP